MVPGVALAGAGGGPGRQDCTRGPMPVGPRLAEYGRGAGVVRRGERCGTRADLSAMAYGLAFWQARHLGMDAVGDVRPEHVAGCGRWCWQEGKDWRWEVEEGEAKHTLRTTKEKPMKTTRQPTIRMTVMGSRLNEMSGSACTETSGVNGGMFLRRGRMAMSGERRWLVGVEGG